MKISKKIIVLLSILPTLAFAAITNQEFDALKNSGISFEVAGVICEQVARIELAKTYAGPTFSVLTGIAYADEQRTIGELDVIVFDNNSQKAIAVGEVKCWKDLRAGLNKAREQRQRFLNAIHSNRRYHFTSTSNGEKFNQDYFEYISNFFSISQKGGESFGFDKSLDYTLEDLMKMRQTIIRCQNAGQCRKAAK